MQTEPTEQLLEQPNPSDELIPIPAAPLQALSASRIREIFRLYTIYRNYVMHEDLLISQRLQRMLIIQGFVFAATGSLLSNFGEALASTGDGQSAISDLVPRLAPTLVYGGFLLVLAISGALTAYVAQGSLSAAIGALKNLRRLWAASVTKEERQFVHLPGIQGGGSKKIHRRGNRHIVWLPRFFMAVWAGVSILLVIVLLKTLFFR